MDFDTKKIIDDLDEQSVKNHANLRIEMFQYTVEWRAIKKLKELSDENEKLKFELAVAEQQADAWSKAFYDEVKKNVELKAQMMKDEVK